ncbi:MAG: hypothetical protein ACO3A2_00420 [Bdellovibrionia bacterium]
MNPPVELSFAKTLQGILRNRCPACMKGSVFSGLYQMPSSCVGCGFLFEKEPGYFLGSVIAAYFIGAFCLVPTLILLFFWLKLEPVWIVFWGVVQIAVSHPFLFHISRLTWLYVENQMTQTLTRGSDHR